MENPKDIVRTGYDSLSYAYRKDSDEPPNHKRWSDLLLSTLPPPPGRILDVGCGCGIPIARDLANAGYTVTGVDLSPVQIARARALVPSGTFIEGDITSQALADAMDRQGPFDAIVMLYVIIHVPIAEQPGLIERMSNWVKDGGYCMLVTGVTAWTGEGHGWLGTDKSIRMWWQQAGLAEYKAWIANAGFDIIVEEHTPEEPGDGHQFFLLKKRGRQIE